MVIIRTLNEIKMKATNKVTKSTVRHSPMEHPRHQYPDETKALEEIAKGCGLVETIKWGKPCFTLDDRNIVLIQRFNKYIALMFFKGALLEDREKVLFRISDNMDVPRQLRFTSLAEVTRLKTVVAAYIEEAIDLERSGAQVKSRPREQLEVPVELRVRLKENPELGKAFSALTPGRQKGYIFHIAGAKQSSTRMSRVDKNSPRILAGKGLND